mgnify:CR=1 FL=1
MTDDTSTNNKNTSAAKDEESPISSASRCLRVWGADEQLLHHRGIAPLVYFYSDSSAAALSTSPHHHQQQPFRSSFRVRQFHSDERAFYPMTTLYVPIPDTEILSSADGGDGAGSSFAAHVSEPVVVDVAPNSMDATVVS